MTETPRPEQGHETVNRESHPNADSPEGLEGDMGLSSERSGPYEGIEGMGSQASAASTTDGETPTVIESPDHPAEEDTPSIEGQTAPDKPDRTSPVTNVDRTQGEIQPDPVAQKHEFDRNRNPGH